MITREEALQMAEEVTTPNIPIDGDRVIMYRAELTTFANLAYERGLEDAAKVVEHWNKDNHAFFTQAIRELKPTQSCNHNCNQGRNCTCK